MFRGLMLGGRRFSSTSAYDLVVIGAGSGMYE